MEASYRGTSESVEFGRIVAFTDGVFAIAITLLVLAFDVPEPTQGRPSLASYLDALGGDVLAYFLTFAVVGRLWFVHHRLFSMLEGFDARLMVLNLVYLSMIVLIPFPAELLGDYGEQRIPVVIYAGVLGAAASLNWLMARHAMRAGLVHDHHNVTTRSRGEREALLIPAVFVVSVPVALLSPLAAQLMWLALVLGRLGREWFGRR